MLGWVESSPAQWEAARSRVEDMPLPDVAVEDLNAVIVAGMGGSGIAGDVAAVAASRTGRVPVVAVKGYVLPAYTDAHSLVITVSHSGNTEETLACFEAAGRAGATRLAVTSGGELAEIAERDGVPVVAVPGEGQPRANLPNLVVPVLGILDRVGVTDGVASQLVDVGDHLRVLTGEWGGEVETAANPVKQLAGAVHDTVPVFYGASGWPALVALRAKCEVNENAKTPAFVGELPEMNHNEVVGWGPSGDAPGEFSAVAMRSPADEHVRIAPRFAATDELLDDRIKGVHTIDMPGPTPLARFAAGVLFVDLLSVYLAYLAGVDPTPVAAIDRLKAHLADADV